MVTKKPRKQRRRMYSAPLHKRQKMVGVHLSKDMRTQLKRKTLPARKGDEVKVARGKFKGKTGKIIEVMLKDGRVLIDNIKRKKSNGEEVKVPIHPSNLIMLNPDMNDSKRLKR